ncbi:MAG: efflux RND transporter periplasmic adaptor subunit [Synechococcaceae cyanobacterium]
MALPSIRSEAADPGKQRLVTVPSVRKPKRRRVWLALALVAAVGGGIAFELLVRRPQAAQQAADAIQTVAVKRMDLGASTEAGGEVNAVRRVNLSPNVASRIERLYIREGDRVQAGQLVAEMESDQLQAKLNQVRAQLQGAQAQLEGARADAEVARSRRARHEPLLASGAISMELMEELRNAERQAQIRVQEAAVRIEEARFLIQQSEAELRNTKVYTPFAGIITRLYAQEGQFVTPTTAASEGAGATSTSIAELSSGLEVIAKLPEASLTEIVPGQSAEVRTDAFPNDVFRGTVNMVSPRAVAENEVNSFPVTVAIETGLGTLKPAMKVQVRFLADPIPNALVIPLAALTSADNDSKGVIRSKPVGGLEFVPVTPGRISGDYVQIVDGLEDGDRVLISAPPPGVQIPGFAQQN